MRGFEAVDGRVDVMPLLLSPGQGAQTAGMLRPWLELPGSAATLERWSRLTGLDLVALGTDADVDELRRTQVAQPLLTAAALLSGRALLAGSTPAAVCGHSVGELSALALAGVLDDDEAVVLAAGRGRLMAEAAAARPTGMAAVLGGHVDDSELAAAGLEPATVNVAGQVVVGGPVAALDAWVPPAGARVRRLDVAGAFHTSAMAPAVDGFAALVAALRPRDAQCDVIANADGAVLRDGRTLLDRLVDQLVRPVRFDLCLAAASGPAVELAPAGVLAPLVKRARPDLVVTSLRTPADLLVTA
jgi:[acyl-carrier-protein] S-malonyltransferase